MDGFLLSSSSELLIVIAAAAYHSHVSLDYGAILSMDKLNELPLEM